MLRRWHTINYFRKYSINSSNRAFLTHDYKCSDAWNTRIESPLLKKVNLGDFYNLLNHNFSAKGNLSAIDVDIFANAIRDSTYLEELRDLLHKLRLSSDTGNTLSSTHHATIRNYLEYGEIRDLIDILNDPLNFGIFLDDFTANILLDKLISSESFKEASNVASLIMLQEDYTNDITNVLCMYACYKFILNQETVVEPNPESNDDKNKKGEVMKIRIKFLRNPYFDDHFDLQDPHLLSGKTLAWLSENSEDNLHLNLQIIGWLMYKKYDKLTALCKKVQNNNSFKVYNEVLKQLTNQCEKSNKEENPILVDCFTTLSKCNLKEVSLEESLINAIENAINKTQSKDISTQQELFKTWSQIREEKLLEQTHRLDRAKRVQLIQNQQEQLEEQEQKLWFFDKEDEIDLVIEEKEQLSATENKAKATLEESEENYIPPEVKKEKRK